MAFNEITVTSGGGVDQFSVTSSVRGAFDIDFVPSNDFSGTLVVQRRNPDLDDTDYSTVMSLTEVDLAESESYKDAETATFTYRIGAEVAPSAGSCVIRLYVAKQVHR